MKIITEGVLIFASAQGLYKEYKDKKFNYEFPNGLFTLLEQQTIIALTTSDGDNLIIEFIDNSSSIQEDFDKEIKQIITLWTNDKLLILSHADFTQICDNQGDSDSYRWPIMKFENIESGKYLVNIKVKNTSDEFEKYQAYFKLSVSMNKIESSEINNKVFEISN